MKIDSRLSVRLTAAFAPLKNQSAHYPFPASDSLSRSLNASVPRRSPSLAPKKVGPEVAQLFATAAVNMWMRAVHSFLISASLTDVSPIWASVAGYYSSHYSIRALAHLLGFFRLFSRGYMVRLQLTAGQHFCIYSPQKGREHHLYWAIVRADPHFGTDPFFTQGNQEEVDHRDWAQYTDHVPLPDSFKPLNKEALRVRIDRISDIPFDAPPIPGAYPDVDSVQVIAYHRLVRVRAFVDSIIGDDSTFWKINRNPTWAIEFMDFQLTEGRRLHSEFTLQ